MHIQSLNGKNICILGFGREGQATLRALQKYAPEADVTVADQDELRSAICDLPENRNSKLEAHSRKLQIGKNYLKGLDQFDVVIKSPGIPLFPEIQAVKEKLTSPTQIFFDSIAKSGAIVIGVTGSKGKSTTATLIHRLLEAGNKKSFLVGNIGEPALNHLEDAKMNTFFVHELSSFQLENLTVSLHIAVITTFFPEHLDRHGSLENYKEAKTHITRFQKEADFVFFNAENEDVREIASHSIGTKVGFTKKDAPIALEESQLLGVHNLMNMIAADKVAEHFGVPADVRLHVISSFKGLPHRLESIGTYHGIAWVNDAISTTPESTIAALDALRDKVTTIILGGKDRGNDFGALAKRIKKSTIKLVILFPGSGQRIREALEHAGVIAAIHESDSMEDAVAFAKENTEKNTICLLSTASPSYGMFKNFEEKGEKFKETIRSL